MRVPRLAAAVGVGFLAWAHAVPIAQAARLCMVPVPLSDSDQCYGPGNPPLIMDARNMLRPAEMKALGFEYMSFGRPDQVAAVAMQ